ncbi:sema domain, immunoglobulin domain (Ig), short basic domain, secreted, (semaphorin) 3H isoform X1 [Osmerus mordax]|uniref:sema domain, immunoglobulin domain (Ig), short basic domain, secreted, (semaphorin) 3H isoform X1 n=1 Tax=Osmerus mordax TaxID=8014 RepID=UPI00350EAE3C
MSRLGTVLLLLLAHMDSTLTGAWRAYQPRLQFTHSELVQNGRLLTLPLVAGDLHSLLPDEDGRRLYVAMKDNLLSTSLDDITQNPRKLYWPASSERVEECLMAGKDRELECANFLRVLQPYNQTHLYVCGTGAFNPRCAFIPTSLFLTSDRQTLSSGQTESGKGKCPYDPHQRAASAIVDGELYAGISSDFMSRDSAFFRSLGSRHVIRTEQYDSTWLQDAQFVAVAPMSETDNPEDDKVYVFFTERAQEAEGAAGKVLYSRVARVCKNDIGGQRSLVNKWSTFQKARMVCSIPGPDGIHTHFHQLQDIFILQGKDQKNPLIYGLFTTSSDVLNGSAVCVYRMQDVVRAFKGSFYHKEGPQYKWAEFTGKVPYPRPGTCPSSTYGSYHSTREYPDDVIFFSRTHPLLQEAVLPLGGRPLLVRVGVHYKFSRLLVDRVEAVDGQYDVLFIGTDSGLVLKSIHLPIEQGPTQEVTLEQLQVFQHKSPVTAMTLSKKKQWLFVGSAEGVAQLALFQCELYGQACAECCLARDPYCTWDGHACSPFMPVARRRNARQVGEDQNPLTQCVRQGAGLQVKAEQRRMVVAEGNSTYLECLPKSKHAVVTWFKEPGENSPELQQVVSGDLLVVVDRGILIRRAEPSHSGVYHCQLEEHGFHWTAVTVRLSVWSTAPRTATSWSLTNPSTGSPPGSAQPWYQDVMALIHPSSMEQHCLSLGYRRPRHRHPNREHSPDADPQKGEGPRGERHKHGGRGGGGRGRKSRSKPQQRSPRSA